MKAMNFQVLVLKVKKKMRNKERRLPKFHQKLVKTSGLPPSRLMEQKSSLDLIKMNLNILDLLILLQPQ